MDARKSSQIVAKGTEAEWAGVLEDLEQAEVEWGELEISDGTKYLMIALKNALK